MIDEQSSIMPNQNTIKGFKSTCFILLTLTTVIVVVVTGSVINPFQKNNEDFVDVEEEKETESRQPPPYDDVNILHPKPWFMHFLTNLLDYLIVIIPVAILVLLARHNLLPSIVQQNKFVKLLVWGVENGATLEDGLPLVQSDVVDLDEKSVKEKKPSKEKNQTFLHLLFCFGGLQISFLTWGILQEKIMTKSYVLKQSFLESHLNRISDNLITIVAQGSKDPDLIHVKFQNAQFLVLINRILAFTLAVIVLMYRNRLEQNQNRRQSAFFQTKQPPFYKYIYCSLSNILSSWCQYEALKFVSFPAQVLSKGCKMIPTMLMNRVLTGKNQNRQEWMFALAISFGMTIFMLNEHRDTKINMHQETSLESSNIGFLSGLIILALYLTFDSFTSNWQQTLFDQYRSLTSIHMMAAVNFYSILFTLISLLKQNDLFPALSVLFANPTLLKDCLILSICSASGQLFIFHTISTFGAIVFSLIMTLRQALAILLSCLIYSHSISWLGWFGILIIFASLFTKSCLKFIEKRIKSQSKVSKSNHQNVI